MNFRIVLSLLLLALLFQINLFAQFPSQTIRGTILDEDTKMPLIGATVQLINSVTAINDVTDFDGQFKLLEIPVGRQSIEVSYLGYEPAILNNMNIVAGKELVLTIELRESLNVIDEIVVTAKSNKLEALNEMATVSSRSFSVEETQRYAASFLDPARMAQNFAGVSSGGDDLTNEIVIRGNSPAYVQWRLEGVEIPSPNHFGNKGSSGGGISMLSNNILADSDFYTGAFPAEIGNALGGAFDLNFRNGNNEKREHSFMAGVTGIEASTEGPLGKNSKASYLFNYRYSVLQLLTLITDLNFGDFDPNFQDLSFKINVPTKRAGVFSLFGLGAISQSGSESQTDTTQWRQYNDIFDFNESKPYALLGLTHRYLFKNQKTYLRTVLSGSLEHYKYTESFLDIANDLAVVEDETEDLRDESFRTNIVLNHKANARHSFRAGTTLSLLSYDFNFSDRALSFTGDFRIDYGPLNTFINSSGSTNMIQFFGQHRFRLNENWTLNSGLHFIRLGLTESQAIEPRFSISRALGTNQKLTLSGGFHSQAEHLINYTLASKDATDPNTLPNIDLELTKAAHFVLAYDLNLSDQMRIKVEGYYQSLFDVPVDTNFVGGTILNATDVYDVIFNSINLESIGKGRNVGIDLTVEKFLSQGYYYLITGSWFDSNFLGQDGESYSTKYNTRYNLTAVAGKEFKVGKNEQNIIALNSKIIYNGGNRYTEFDFDQFAPTSDGVFKLQAEPYFRIDFSLAYKKNRKLSTHSIIFDIQNLTNRENVFNRYPDFNNRTYRTEFQSGIIPNINYRVEF